MEQSGCGGGREGGVMNDEQVAATRGLHSTLTKKNAE
jgi:hypothetical protein